MSSKNNVNPDHYKVRGRLRPGEDLVPELEKQKAAKVARHQPAGRGRWAPSGPDSKPGPEDQPDRNDAPEAEGKPEARAGTGVEPTRKRGRRQPEPTDAPDPGRGSRAWAEDETEHRSEE